MIDPNTQATIEIMGSDWLREYRDAVIKELARREANVAPVNVVRDNVQIRVEHVTREMTGGPVILKEFALHRGELARGDGVMINRDSTRDHLWVEARWL